MATTNNRQLKKRGRILPGVGCQAIEGNPLTSSEVAMFEMFEREGWDHERRRKHILTGLMQKS